MDDVYCNLIPCFYCTEFPDEVCFDSYLNKIPKHEFLTDLPKVLVECVQLLEGTPEYLDTHGLYRISPNHAVVQKLRFKIDADKYKALKEQRDPHTFTGIIKLFLRELKEPLISFNTLEQIVGSLDYRSTLNSTNLREIVNQ